MKFYSQQFPDGRWGIYQELQLMATVGSVEACEEILSCLRSSQKKTPKRIDVLAGEADILDRQALSEQDNHQQKKQMSA